MARITWTTLRTPGLSKLRERIESGGNEPSLTPDDVVNCCCEFCEAFPDAEFGGAHVVVSDFNTETPNIAFCLRELARSIRTDRDRKDAEAIHFLGCLLELDDFERIVHTND